MSVQFVNLAGIRSRLKALINRRDLTDDLANQFIQQAQSDLERVMRIGYMEQVLQATLPGGSNAFTVPWTYLQTINVFTTKGEIIQVDMDEWLKAPEFGPAPTMYVRVGNKMLFKPAPPPEGDGIDVFLHCYVQSPPLLVDTDRNVWTQSATNLLVYTAAELAADYFQDDVRVARFSAKAMQYRDEIMSQDLDEKFAGPMRLKMPYGGDF